MTDPVEAYQRLLELRDERRAQTHSSEVDAAIDRMRDRMIAELRLLHERL